MSSALHYCTGAIWKLGDASTSPLNFSHQSATAVAQGCKGKRVGAGSRKSNEFGPSGLTLRATMDGPLETAESSSIGMGSQQGEKKYWKCVCVKIIDFLTTRELQSAPVESVANRWHCNVDTIGRKSPTDNTHSCNLGGINRWPGNRFRLYYNLSSKWMLKDSANRWLTFLSKKPLLPAIKVNFDKKLANFHVVYSIRVWVWAQVRVATDGKAGHLSRIEWTFQVKSNRADCR